jgi:Mannosyl-glycoprotein endo-beta-N-acetylglucosaminidase
MAFRDDLSKYAQDMGAQYNILPSFMMAVAILETGNGTSQLCTRAHNLFSIKGTYNGAFIQLPTAEYYNGMRTTVEANFRKYPNYGASFKDFCELIKNGVSWDKNKYKAVIGEKDIDRLCHLFAQSGYMTDPNYENKLKSIISEQNLVAFDPKPQAVKATTSQPPLTSPQKGLSITDYLKSRGIDSSFANRNKLATLMGMKNYEGTAEQNSQMLAKMTKYQGEKYVSIIDYMKDHGLKTNLPLLADFLDVPNYKGTAQQNVNMLKKLGAQ